MNHTHSLQRHCIHTMILLLSCCSALLAVEGTASKQVEAPIVTPHKIPKIDQFNLDGNAADWPAHAPIVHAFSEDAVPGSNSNDISATLQIAWNEQGLLVLVNMHSQHPWVEDTDLLKLYQKDSIELFLRQGSAWRNLVQAVISPGFSTDQDKARKCLWDYRGRDEKWKSINTEVQFASKKHKRNELSGGSIEVLIPWAQLLIKPASGLEVEFRININKVLGDGKRRQLTWRRSDGDMFQRLILSDTNDTMLAIQQAAWIDHSSVDQIGVSVRNLQADNAAKIQIKQDDKTILSAAINQQSNLWIDRSQLGNGKIDISIDNTLITSEQIKDPIPGLRLSLERVFVRRSFRGNNEHMRRLSLKVPQIIKGEALPNAQFADPTLAQRIGVTSLKTVWFNNDYKLVSEAKTDGRYAAEITAILADGTIHKTYRVALKLPADQQVQLSNALGAKDGIDVLDFIEAGIDAEGGALASLAHSLHNDDIYADRSLRKWLHGLRKTLSNETRYVYNKRMPKGYDDDKEKLWPAILYLHGSNGRLPSQQEDREKRRTEVLDRDLMGWSKGNPKPFAMYPLISDGGWEPEAVIDVLDQILKDDRIDPNRVILMGFSMGGMGTWRTVTQYPERFAAAVPIGGRGDFAYLAHRVKNLPTWVINGDADRSTTLEAAMQIVNALKAIDADVRLTVLPGVGHGGSQNGCFETPGIWEWLEAQNLNKRH